MPEIYHELEPPGTVLPYDQAGADTGNVHQFAKPLAAFDDDARATLQYLSADLSCTGKLGVVGICIGGHLAFRAAMNPEVLAAVCFYATDVHSGTKPNCSRSPTQIRRLQPGFCETRNKYSASSLEGK